MARFRPSDFVSPSSSEEIVSILKQAGSRARILAGGTAFYEMAKRGMMPEVEQILDLSKLNLAYSNENPDSCTIGAMTILSDLMKASLVKRRGFEALDDFLTRFTPIQIRNLATVGGELCAGIPFLDLPVVALALDAKFKIQGPNGTRTVAAESFFLDYFLVELKRGEYLTEMILPGSKEGTASAFTNLKRTASDLSLVNVAARVTTKGGKLEEVRIGLGGMGTVPLRAREIEKTFEGRKIDQLDMARALKSIDDLSPISSVHASPWYKKEICKVLVRDAVRLAITRCSRSA
jgi:aerobic carbon-monoxide dehydrogenase medium subunit